jgi:deazaflavin-dependent oxidoreductase (nitroreductase family)
MTDRYVRPGWFTNNVFNRIVAWFTRGGLSILGSRVLAVRGRQSGEWRTTPVNLLTYQGRRYLVAPRGVTQWVRNIRVSGTGELRVGRRREPIQVVELTDDEKPPLLRAYLRRWKVEVGVFFQGVGPDASEAELRRIAPDYPVFRILDAGKGASVPPAAQSTARN